MKFPSPYKTEFVFEIVRGGKESSAEVAVEIRPEGARRADFEQAEISPESASRLGYSLEPGPPRDGGHPRQQRRGGGPQARRPHREGHLQAGRVYPLRLSAFGRLLQLHLVAAVQGRADGLGDFRRAGGAADVCPRAAMQSGRKGRAAVPASAADVPLPAAVASGHRAVVDGAAGGRLDGGFRAGGRVGPMARADGRAARAVARQQAIRRAGDSDAPETAPLAARRHGFAPLRSCWRSSCRSRSGTSAR